MARRKMTKRARAKLERTRPERKKLIVATAVKVLTDPKATRAVGVLLETIGRGMQEAADDAERRAEPADFLSIARRREGGS